MSRRVNPEKVDNSDFSNVFGKTQREIIAEAIVQLAKKRKAWEPFTVKQLVKFSPQFENTNWSREGELYGMIEVGLLACEKGKYRIRDYFLKRLRAAGRIRK